MCSALLPGTELNHKYIVEEILGQGGFGVTYKCSDKQHPQELYAIKEFLPLGNGIAYRNPQTLNVEIYSQKEELFKYLENKFESEAAVLQKFTYPSLVKVLDTFDQFQTHYAVMKYAGRYTLDRYISEHKPWKFHDVYLTFEELIQGLHEVHQMNLQHRDIKPANICVQEEAGAMQIKPNWIHILFIVIIILPRRFTVRKLKMVLIQIFIPWERYFINL